MQGGKKIKRIQVIQFFVACFLLSLIAFQFGYTDDERLLEVESPDIFLAKQTRAPTSAPMETPDIFLAKQTRTPTSAPIDSVSLKIKTIDSLDYPAHSYTANKKYIFFNWNSGRLNNQIRALEASMAYAKYYNRSLVIPKPRRLNEVTGIHYGLWDLHWLMTKVDFLLESDMPEELVKLLGNPLQYTNFRDLPKDGEAFNPEEECWVHKLIHEKIPNKIQNECKIVYLKESPFGVFRWESETTKVSDWLRPAKYIRDAVENFSLKHFPNGTMRIGVHNRAMKEGGVKDDIPYMCRWKGMSVFSSRPDAQFMKNWVGQYTKGNLEERDKILHIYWESCAIKFDALKEILEFHGQEPPNIEEKFFLGDDGTAPEVLRDLKNHGAVVWEAHEHTAISKAKQMADMSKTVYGCAPCFQKIAFEKLERSVLDMLTFTNVQFFVGSWMSTFTETTCRWRGIGRSTNSSLCFFKERWRQAVQKKAKYK